LSIGAAQRTAYRMLPRGGTLTAIIDASSRLNPKILLGSDHHAAPSSR
jgi:hypothetical protein